MSYKEKIEEMKRDLDKLILDNAEYQDIYNLSIRLDELIVEYYKENSCTMDL